MKDQQDKLKIVTDPTILAQLSVRVSLEDIKSNFYASLIADMRAVLVETHGIGLAAIQLGVPIRLVVTHVGSEYIAMFNPEILSSKGLSTMKEGCLSIPGKRFVVQRSKFVKYTYLDERGNACKAKSQARASHVVQHEIDHLNGVLISACGDVR